MAGQRAGRMAIMIDLAAIICELLAVGRIATGRRRGPLVALSLLLRVSHARATTITVTTTDDEVAVTGNCSLREAVIAANTDAAVDAYTEGGSK